MLYLLQAEGKDGALVGVEPGRLGLGGETSRTWAVFTREGTPPHGYRPQEESLPSPWGQPPTPALWGLTWAVCRLLGRHLHEESHLLTLGEGVAGPDPRQPHAKQQPGLPGDRLLLNPLPLRTLLLCEVVGEEERGRFQALESSEPGAFPGMTEPPPPTSHGGKGKNRAGSSPAAHQHLFQQ